MRRVLMLCAATLVAGAAAVCLLRPSAIPADPILLASDPAEPQGPKAVQLPINQVVLFSSGVGYFQRQGTVDGDARVDLAFPVNDINDLLKSLVLRDDGGHVSAVSYDSNAPPERTLQSFAVNLTTNPSLAQILDQARGERAEVVLLPTAAGQAATLRGAIVGTEKKRVAVGKEVVEAEVLNLSCGDGLRAVKLSDVERVHFLNPVLESEFRKALETLAQSHDARRKAVTIRFSGKGKREVRVGYVVDNPVWKTSYRLVLGPKGSKPFLQGWAVVENPSDEDWKDVRVALVSGRPISFRMDLYSPLYVPRPLVEPELLASLRPPTYSGAMSRRAIATAPCAPPPPPMAACAPPMPTCGTAGINPATADNGAWNDQNQTFALNSGVASAASAAKLGDFFRYVIDKSVSLPRQKSALLPIVGKDVQATRVSIYNDRVQAKFPLLGLKFKNTSGLHLMQGPITVFDGPTYAGDARILDIQPGEERLLSYAVDLGTEVNPVYGGDNRITRLEAVKGMLSVTTTFRDIKTYTVTNRNDQERLVLIEHPVRNDYKLVDTTEPAETSRDFYRFQLKVPPGKTARQVVTEERVYAASVALGNAGDDQIRIYVNLPVTSARVKASLHKAMELRGVLEATRREIQEQQRQLQVIVNDQARLRANVKELPPTAPAYKRYLKKFDDQETQIEKYQAAIRKLQAVEHNQQKDFDDFLAGFTAE